MRNDEVGVREECSPPKHAQSENQKSQDRSDASSGRRRNGNPYDLFLLVKPRPSSSLVRWVTEIGAQWRSPIPCDDPNRVACPEESSRLHGNAPVRCVVVIEKHHDAHWLTILRISIRAANRTLTTTRTDHAARAPAAAPAIPKATPNTTVAATPTARLTAIHTE